MRVRVFLIEADGRRRLSFSARISRCAKDIDFLGAVRKAQEALLLLESLGADVLLLGSDGTKGGVLRSVAALRAIVDTPILLLSGGESSADIASFLEAGVVGVLDRGAGPVASRDAIRSVSAGGVFLSPERTRGLLEHLGALPRESRSSIGGNLTPREREVLARLSRGDTYDRVADRLGIRIGTVQSHVKSIYRKLSVCSKTAATHVAFSRGLI